MRKSILAQARAAAAADAKGMRRRLTLGVAARPRLIGTLHLRFDQPLAA